MVIPGTRNQVMDALVPYIGLVNSRKGLKDLKKSLYHHLTKNHPIHDALGSLSAKDVRRLRLNLHLDAVKGGYVERNKKVLARYFFEKFPDAPLTNLNRILEEDSYFDQLTSGKTCSFYK